MDKQHLSEELVREHAERTVKRAEKTWNSYHRGFLTQEDVYEDLHKEVLGEGVLDFLKESGLKMDLREDRFVCFQKDSEAFRKGAAQAECSPSPWLFSEQTK